MGHKSANWKKKEDKEVEATNVEVLLGCTKTSAIEYETDEALFEFDLWELALQKLNEVLVPSNPPDESKHNKGNTNKEKIKEVGLAGEKASSGTKCCLNKIVKLAVPNT